MAAENQISRKRALTLASPGGYVPPLHRPSQPHVGKPNILETLQCLMSSAGWGWSFHCSAYLFDSIVLWPLAKAVGFAGASAKMGWQLERRVAGVRLGVPALSPPPRL